MTPLAITLAIACQLFLVAGQLCLKRAMRQPPIKIPWLAGGITLHTAWFFLWLALLAKWDLSRIYPFEGLNPALIVAGAAIYLRERVPVSAWIGIAMISAGVAIISA